MPECEPIHLARISRPLCLCTEIIVSKEDEIKQQCFFYNDMQLAWESWYSKYPLLKWVPADCSHGHQSQTFIPHRTPKPTVVSLFGRYGLLEMQDQLPHNSWCKTHTIGVECGIRRIHFSHFLLLHLPPENIWCWIFFLKNIQMGPGSWGPAATQLLLLCCGSSPHLKEIRSHWRMQNILPKWEPDKAGKRLLVKETSWAPSIYFMFIFCFSCQDGSKIHNGEEPLSGSKNTLLGERGDGWGYKNMHG